MNAGAIIASTFPEVEFTGASYKHRSFAKSWSSNLPFANKKGLIHLIHSKAGGLVVNALEANFSKMEFMITSRDLVNLFVADAYRHLSGKGDTKEPTKLRNPITGNVFHRIALYKNIVGGIRFWVVEVGDTTIIGYRFRLEVTKDMPTTSREKARQQSEQFEKVAQKIIEDLHIPEPMQEEQPQRVRIIGE